ncbi:MAG: hypothetical protein AAF703_19855 [Cyanobacteria bacterium P01_D01_bin.105]
MLVLSSIEGTYSIDMGGKSSVSTVCINLQKIVHKTVKAPIVPTDLGQSAL